MTIPFRFFANGRSLKFKYIVSYDGKYCTRYRESRQSALHRQLEHNRRGHGIQQQDQLVEHRERESVRVRRANREHRRKEDEDPHALDAQELHDRLLANEERSYDRQQQVDVPLQRELPLLPLPLLQCELSKKDASSVGGVAIVHACQ